MMQNIILHAKLLYNYTFCLMFSLLKLVCLQILFFYNYKSNMINTNFSLNAVCMSFLFTQLPFQVYFLYNFLQICMRNSCDELKMLIYNKVIISHQIIEFQSQLVNIIILPSSEETITLNLLKHLHTYSICQNNIAAVVLYNYYWFSFAEFINFV